jgi:hypothetical protein
MKLFFPDTLWNPNQVSGASFLYFSGQPIALTLHASVSTFITGVDPFQFLPYVRERNPAWLERFGEFFGRWHAFSQSRIATRNLLEPLSGVAFKNIQISYDRGQLGWKHAQELLDKCSLDRDEISKLIDPFHAADELFAHIFFEKVLEALHPNASTEDFIEIGRQAAATSYEVRAVADFDWEYIYQYCDQLFGRTSLSDLLTQAYMFRMPILAGMDEVLLSNGGLLKFLSHLENVRSHADRHYAGVPTDVIAWEFFRQIVSPYVDPLDEKAVSRIGEILTKRQGEVERLRNKCLDLALGVGSQDDLRSLIPKVREHIKAKIVNELEDLLKLDQRSFSTFMSDLFSDEKSWIAISAFLAGLLNGGEVLTAAGAISALALVGAEAVKQSSAERRELAVHPLTLIYRLSR